MPCSSTSPVRRLRLPLGLILVVVATLLALPAAAQTSTWEVQRIAGEDATVLSAAISNRAVVDASTVVLARADDYPDALAGAPLAGLLDAPILLIPRDDIPDHVYTEIDRLRPDAVVLLGGTSAIGTPVESILRDRLSIQEVRRIGGESRFETAALIAAEVAQRSGATRAYLVRGEHPEPVRAWPDAVAVSALAARHGRPIVLASHTSLPEHSLRALRDAGITDVTIVGGPVAVGDDVGAAVAEAGFVVDRLAGDTRFATSLAVAQQALGEGADDGSLWLVSGGRFADALVASVAVAREDGVMLVVDGGNWPTSAARDFVLDRAGTARAVTVVGSPDDVPYTVDHELVVRRTGQPAAAPTGGAVRIEVGQDLQQVVDAHPAGTHFVIGSGTHREQSVIPRSGDRFTGEPGAVLSGARPFPTAAFTRQPDGRWTAPAPTEDPVPLSPNWEIEAGAERQALPHELWGDHVRLRHVNSLDQVDRPRTWFFDYAGDQLVMFDDPRSYRSVELSLEPFAFGEAPDVVTDVIIEDLTVMRYATLPTDAAIQGPRSRSWTIRQVDVLENHAAGVEAGPGMRIERSRFIRNGQMGISGTDVDFSDGTHGPIAIEGNEIAHNGELRFLWAWEAGSVKLGGTTGLVMRGNWIHNHRGPGPWVDVDSIDSTIESNLIEFNMINGVMYEISEDALITGNTIRHNGVLAVGDLGAGLWISNSTGVVIRDNLIEGNRLPINAQSSPVEAGRGGDREVRDLLVEGNDMRIDYLAPGLRVTSQDDHLYTDGNNRFEDNTYRLRPQSDRNFFWGRFFTSEGWQQELGHDDAGRFIALDAPGTRPTAPFELRSAGAPA